MGIDDLYASCVAHPNVVRVLALSGGFDRREACARLKRQSGVIASFSRALTEGLSRDMDDATFSAALDASCAALYDASFKKNNGGRRRGAGDVSRRVGIPG